MSLAVDDFSGSMEMMDLIESSLGHRMVFFRNFSEISFSEIFSKENWGEEL